jgi:1-acyl-sn-glycerol-3-phosphate acyltransferase
MNRKTLTIKDKTIFDGRIIKPIFKLLYTIIFKAAGWKMAGNAPQGAGITIAAPHTSNWDIFFALGSAIKNNVKIYFSVKESWCKIPVMGKFILWLGGIPIDRSKPGGQVDLIKNFVEKHKSKRIFFLFTPEGTRGMVEKWKTGFYHVAKDCGLPIFLAKVDYRIKEAGVFHTFQLTGNKEDDIRAIQESYKSVCARHPEKQFPAYAGPLPEVSEDEASIMRSLYNLKRMATAMEIGTKAKIDQLSTSMLDFLIGKGLLERATGINPNDREPRYRLTSKAMGLLLHLYPTMV